MQIILLRHGKVNYPPITMLSASSFSQWVADYDSNELDVSSKPTEEAMGIAKQTNAVVCSILPRSLESAKVLRVEGVTLSHSLFNEAGLPIANWKFPRLSVRIWAIIFRLAWFLGYSANSETLKEAKKRSSQAANKLIKMAEEHKSVMFIGHGIINRFIAYELRELGWEGPKKPSRNYWEFGVFTQKI
ncbi:MAG: histidine phosphatase family protein [Gammaproteobacteria bacterium]|nr:histidine phosphatase family protein [Gammaproteobacteria bacterium]